MLDFLITLLVSIFPVIIIIYFVYKKDLVEKEPIPLLIDLLKDGFLAVIIVYIISSIISNFISLDYMLEEKNIIGIFIYSFIMIALVEEGTKFILLKKRVWNNSEFNYRYDIILYSVVLSLGFALIENLLYIFVNGIGIALSRAIFSIPGHAFFGIFMGYFLGLSKIEEIKNNKKTRSKYIIISLLIPVLLHGIYNFLIFMDLPVFSIIFVIYIIFLYIISFMIIKKVSKINKSLIQECSNVICTKCGYTQSVNNNYCPSCGTKN